MSSSQPADPSSDIHSLPLFKRIYKNGTLRYTFVGLWFLFFWILWGDFAFCFFESIQRFISLLLDEHKASNTLIINLGSVACVINLLLGPGISQWSDACRTSWGRRRPFLAIAAPLTALSMMMMGVSPEIGTYLFTAFHTIISPYFSENTVILFCFCVFIAFFHYFNMVLCNAFNWFFCDVVPQEVVARMQAAMRVVSIASGMLFNHYVFPHIMTYRVVVCVSIGIFYSVAFLMMCWGVKEGEYPPPEPKPKRTLWQILENYIGYFRECLSVPIYRNCLLIYVISACFGCAGAFAMLFWKNTLHVGMQEMGDLNNWGMGVGLIASLIAGWACDKFNPFRVMIFVQIAQCLVNVFSFYYVHDYHTLFYAHLVGSFINTGFGIGMGTLTIFVFPKEKFAQFSTSTNVIPMGVCIVANFATGLFFDYVLHSNYQYMYIFFAIGTGLSVIPIIFVYRSWLLYGGLHHYQAPHVPHLTPLQDVINRMLNKKSSI